MTEEERIAHATAIKLMGSKDYFVEVYKTALAALIAKAEITVSTETKVSDRQFRTTISTESICESASHFAEVSMGIIDNYGKEK